MFFQIVLRVEGRRKIGMDGERKEGRAQFVFFRVGGVQSAPRV